MKLKILFAFFLLLSQLSIMNCAAQQTFVAAGANVNGSSGSVSFSIGQAVYQTHSNNNGSIIEGIQQPYEIFEVSITDYDGIVITCQVYPNPTTNLIQLQITNYELLINSDLKCSVLDLNGKLLMQHEITNESTEIAMGNLPKGIYLLNIIADKKIAKSFKVIKN